MYGIVYNDKQWRENMVTGKGGGRGMYIEKSAISMYASSSP